MAPGDVVGSAAGGGVLVEDPNAPGGTRVEFITTGPTSRFTGTGRGSKRGRDDRGAAERRRKAAEEAARKKREKLAREKAAKEKAERERLAKERAERLRLARERRASLIKRGKKFVALEKKLIKEDKKTGKRTTVQKTEVEAQPSPFIGSSLLGRARVELSKPKKKPELIKPITRKDLIVKREKPKKRTVLQDPVAPLVLKGEKAASRSLAFIDKKIVDPAVKRLEKKGVSVPKFLTKKRQTTGIFKDVLFLPSLSGSFATKGGRLIRQAAIKEAVKNPKIRFRSVVRDKTTTTAAITNVADKKILTLLKTAKVGEKKTLGSGISAIKTKGGFRFVKTRVGAVTTKLKGTARKAKVVKIGRKLKRAKVKGKVKLKQKLKDADVFASINLERELARQNILLKQRRLGLIKKAKFKPSPTKVKARPTKKTAILTTVQRKGNKLLIRGGKAEFKKTKFGKARKGRFKSTIEGTGIIRKTRKDKNIIIQVGNKIRRDQLVKLKQQLKQAGADIPVSLQSTVKKVTDKVFKAELKQLKKVAKPQIRAVTPSRVAPGLKKQATRTAQATTTAQRRKTKQAPTTAQDQPQAQAQGQRAKQLTRLSTKQKQRLREGLKTDQPTKQQPRTRQRERLKLRTRQLLRQKLRQKTKGRPTPVPAPRIPRPRGVSAPLFLFLLNNKLLKKKKKKKGVKKSGLVLVEGFTAKALRLKPIKIKPSEIRKFAKRFQTIGTRRKPVFVKSKKKIKRGKR